MKYCEHGNPQAPLFCVTYNLFPSKKWVEPSAAVYADLHITEAVYVKVLPSESVAAITSE